MLAVDHGDAGRTRTETSWMAAKAKKGEIHFILNQVCKVKEREMKTKVWLSVYVSVTLLLYDSLGHLSVSLTIERNE